MLRCARPPSPRSVSFRCYHPTPRFHPKSTHYDVLGINRSASQDDIKKAYTKVSRANISLSCLQLAKQYHPDKNKSQNASENFHKLQQAYKVLSDPEQRQMYDVTQGAFTMPPRPNFSQGTANPYYYSQRTMRQSDANNRAWQENTYNKAKAREDYARYQRKEYEVSFQQRKRRMELLFVALCLFFILLWWVPSAVNSITASRTKGVPSALDEEVATDAEPDVFSDFHRRLSQRFVVRAEDNQVLTDEAVVSLITQLPVAEREKIREVKLLNGPQLSDEIFKSLALFPNLRSLDLGGCSQLRGDEFVRLRESGHFQDLEDFEAVNAPKLSANRAFLNSLTHLPSLRLIRIDQPEASLVSLLASAIKLEGLHFERVAGRTMGDSGFKAIATLTSLKTLELPALEGVSDHNIGLLKRLTSLQVLSLRNAPAITASSVASLGENRRLRSLDFSDCTHFSDDALLCVISQFSGLEYLSLAGTAVTDHALFLLGHSRTPKLLRLNLARCSKLTKDSLKEVPNLTTVRDLRLENTVLRKNEVLELKRRFPNRNMRVTVSADSVDGAAKDAKASQTVADK